MQGQGRRRGGVVGDGDENAWRKAGTRRRCGCVVVGVTEEGGAAAAWARSRAQRGRGGWCGGVIFSGDEKECVKG